LRLAENVPFGGRLSDQIRCFGSYITGVRPLYEYTERRVV